MLASRQVSVIDVCGSCGSAMVRHVGCSTCGSGVMVGRDSSTHGCSLEVVECGCGSACCAGGATHTKDRCSLTANRYNCTGICCLVLYFHSLWSTLLWW